MNDSLTQARSLLQQGHIAEAELAFERILEADPANIQALHALTLRELRGGRAAAALALAERAVAATPQDPVGRFNLGLALDAGRGASAAAAEFLAAVQLRPDFFVARLHLADALHRGDDPLAVVQFARAIQDAQLRGKWLDEASTPAHLRGFVEKGSQLLRANRRDAYAALLEPLEREFGAAELRRVREAVAIFLHDRVAIHPDPRQRPTFLYVPGLAPRPWFDTSRFAWTAALEAQTAVIRGELDAVLETHDQAQPERVFTNETLERANLKGTRGAPDWTGYYFYRHGERRDPHCAACPRTAEALDALPLSRVREHGPEVLFSVFSPGTHLLPHRGVTNTRLVGHLPLIVPPDCALVVGGETHEWREGRVVVFDDTYEHEAWNRSDRIRIVLIFDLWHPDLSAAERAAVAALVAAMGDFRHRTAVA